MLPLLRPPHINYFGACSESVPLMLRKCAAPPQQHRNASIKFLEEKMTQLDSAVDGSQAPQQSKQVVDSS